MTLAGRMERGHLQPMAALSLKPAQAMLAAVMLLVMTDCAPAPSGPIVATLQPTTVPAITPVTVTPPPIATRSPTVTVEPVEAAVEAFKGALKASDATALAPLMLQRVLMAQGPDGITGDMVEYDAALAWLNARWGATRGIVSTQYIDHFVLLEIRTTGWMNLPPLTGGIVVFHLHRFNPDGQADPLRGNWRIDSILYQ